MRNKWLLFLVTFFIGCGGQREVVRDIDTVIVTRQAIKDSIQTQIKHDTITAVDHRIKIIYVKGQDKIHYEIKQDTVIITRPIEKTIIKTQDRTNYHIIVAGAFIILILIIIIIARR
mgnify:FL=1|jgi:hypothetical protein